MRPSISAMGRSSSTMRTVFMMAVSCPWKRLAKRHETSHATSVRLAFLHAHKRGRDLDAVIGDPQPMVVVDLDPSVDQREGRVVLARGDRGLFGEPGVEQKGRVVETAPLARDRRPDAGRARDEIDAPA